MTKKTLSGSPFVSRDMVSKSTSAITSMWTKKGFRTREVGGATPSIDLQNEIITYPALPEDATEHDLRMRRGYADHETGHFEYTDKSVGKPSGLVGDLMNCVEDGRLEKFKGRAYKGCQMNFEYINDFHTNSLKEKIAESPDSSSSKFIEAMIGIKSLADETSDFESVLSEFPNNELLISLEPIVSKFSEMRDGLVGTNDSKEIAIEIDRLWKESMEDDSNSSESMDDFEIAGGGSDSSAECDSDSNNGGGNGDSSENGMDGVEKRSSTVDDSVDDSVDDEGNGDFGGGFNNVSDSNDGLDMTGVGDDAELVEPSDGGSSSLDSVDGGVSSGGSNDKNDSDVKKSIFQEYSELDSISETGYEDVSDSIAREIKVGCDRLLGSGSYTPYKDNDVEIKPELGSSAGFDKIMVGSKAKVGVMVSKLISSMKTMKPMYSRYQKRGIIDDMALSRVAVGNYEVFKNRILQPGINTAMTLLIDLSGSMGGSKIKIAIETAIVFSSVLESLNVPHEVLGFTTKNWNGPLRTGYNRTVALNHVVFKDFNERLVSVKGRFSCILNGYDFLKHNVDGEAVLWAGGRLSVRPENRKLLVVLSDGMPECGSNREVLIGHLKSSISDLKKANIGCIGVGVESRSVEDFYDDYVVFNSSKDMTEGFLDKLKSVLQKLVPSA